MAAATVASLPTRFSTHWCRCCCPPIGCLVTTASMSSRVGRRSTGIDLEVLQRLERAAGLPKIDDPDAAVLPRADALAAGRAKVFLDLGMDVADVVDIVRVLSMGLSRTAAMMRQPAFGVTVRPGATELEFAEVAETLARAAVPALGPLVEGLLLRQLRHMFEKERISATERAAGKLPGARHVAVAFADLAGFTRLGETLPQRIWCAWPEDSPNWLLRSPSRPCGSSRPSGMRSCSYLPNHPIDRRGS